MLYARAAQRANQAGRAMSGAFEAIDRVPCGLAASVAALMIAVALFGLVVTQKPRKP